MYFDVETYVDFDPNRGGVEAQADPARAGDALGRHAANAQLVPGKEGARRHRGGGHRCGGGPSRDV